LPVTLREGIFVESTNNTNSLFLAGNRFSTADAFGVNPTAADIAGGIERGELPEWMMNSTHGDPMARGAPFLYLHTGGFYHVLRSFTIPAVYFVGGALALALVTHGLVWRWPWHFASHGLVWGARHDPRSSEIDKRLAAHGLVWRSGTGTFDDNVGMHGRTAELHNLLTRTIAWVTVPLVLVMMPLYIAGANIFECGDPLVQTTSAYLADAVEIEGVVAFILVVIAVLGVVFAAVFRTTFRGSRWRVVAAATTASAASAAAASGTGRAAAADSRGERRYGEKRQTQKQRGQTQDTDVRRSRAWAPRSVGGFGSHGDDGGDDRGVPSLDELRTRVGGIDRHERLAKLSADSTAVDSTCSTTSASAKDVGEGRRGSTLQEKAALYIATERGNSGGGDRGNLEDEIGGCAVVRPRDADALNALSGNQDEPDRHHPKARRSRKVGRCHQSLLFLLWLSCLVLLLVPSVIYALTTSVPTENSILGDRFAAVASLVHHSAPIIITLINNIIVPVVVFYVCDRAGWQSARLLLVSRLLTTWYVN
jgi:hypothetical protein